MSILDACDATLALYWGSFAMAITGIVLALGTKILTFEETMNTVIDGFKLMATTGAILVMAWSLASVTQSLGLGDFVATYVGGNIPTGLLPLLVLICACLVAFATGTSWGTMAIMTPLAIQLGYSVTGDILFSTGMTGAVLSEPSSEITARLFPIRRLWPPFSPEPTIWIMWRRRCPTPLRLFP